MATGSLEVPSRHVAESADPEWLCYGVCQSCGMLICRPANVSQVGMRQAKVCDECWLSAALTYQRKETSLNEIARQFGVNSASVAAKLGRFGVCSLPPSFRKGNTITAENSKRSYQRRREQRDAETYAYRQTERGREQLREFYRRRNQKPERKEYGHEYWRRPEVKARQAERGRLRYQRKKLEREFANGAITT